MYPPSRGRLQAALAYQPRGEEVVFMEQGSWPYYLFHFMSIERGETDAGSSPVHDETGTRKTTDVFLGHLSGHFIFMVTTNTLKVF